MLKHINGGFTKQRIAADLASETEQGGHDENLDNAFVAPPYGSESDKVGFFAGLLDMVIEIDSINNSNKDCALLAHRGLA